MAHEIRIKVDSGNGAMSIDNNTISVNEEMALLMWNAIMEYLNDHCSDCKWTSPHNAYYIMGSLRVKVRRVNDGGSDEITIVFEE